MLTGGVAPLSWWFSGGSASSFAISEISISSVWDKSTVGRLVALISPSAILCIPSS